MSEEMMLMQALCEALGFKVRRHTNYQETMISEAEGQNIIRWLHRDVTSFTLTVGPDGEWIKNDDGGYIRKLKEPEISYTVEKQ